MEHYRSNLRDLEFNLLEVLRRDHVLGAPPYAELDAETARDMLAEADRLARQALAVSFADSDRNPPRFDPQTGKVTLPPSFKESFRAYMDAEWWRMDVPEELGGIPCPPSLRWAIAELILGANPAIHMYGIGPAFAGLLHELGTPDQKRLARHMVERQWGATMVLTEPEAGSDVGAGRTTAVPQPDGSWQLTGVKRFISSGEHDLAGNIVHFVLARPQCAPEGTKGLSLFVVPKFLVDLESGEPTVRNGVYATNVEQKMGPASCGSASGTPPSAGCWATRTTAWPRCSSSSGTPG
jgi:alkylation response protein AidB-like acyl-CoA dehydrogenase